MSIVSTPQKRRPNMGNGTSSHRSKQLRNVPASNIYPIHKVEEVDESKLDDEGNYPDQVSTSASEASNSSSKNSEPPLLDFIGTACMASTWFTSCFPCAVVDINHCDDNVVNKLNRTNAMSVMYGVHDEPPTVVVPNSFELQPGEEEEGPMCHSMEYQSNKMQGDASDVTDGDAAKLVADLEQESETAHVPVHKDTPEKELPPTVHHDTPIHSNSTSRKRFNIRPKSNSVKKLFRRKQQR